MNLIQDIKQKFGQDVSDYILKHSIFLLPKTKYDIKGALGEKVLEYLIENKITLLDEPKSNIEKFIEIEDLSPDMQMIAQDYGLQLTVNLMERYGGLKVHFMQVKSCGRAAKKAVLEKLSEGKNQKEISKELNISLYVIRKILGG